MTIKAINPFYLEHGLWFSLVSRLETGHGSDIGLCQISCSLNSFLEGVHRVKMGAWGDITVVLLPLPFNIDCY